MPGASLCYTISKPRSVEGGGAAEVESPGCHGSARTEKNHVHMGRLRLEGWTMASFSEGTRRPRPMNIYVRRGSRAEDKYRALGGVSGLEPEQIAPGVPPTPAHD